ncbi:MAG TPA: acylphosphatase [Burkholderiales bacterium]|nr:acylphosphatase [Burkholderiales bacterium]
MAKHLIISGRVQGVGYRASMIDEARRLGVAGWVRNRRDGTVEAMVDGDSAAVAALVAWARRGPPGARVADVLVEDSDGTFGEFDWLPTA